MGWYILDKDHNTVPCTDREWVLWQEQWRNAVQKGQPDPNRVAFTEIGGTKVSVSTVFLGLDHNFRGPPHLFETMVFDNIDMTGMDHEMRRYSTWKEAEAGHNEVVTIVRRRLIRLVGE